MSVKLDTGPWGQNSHFHLVGPKKMWPRNRLKLHPRAVFLLLTERALFHPLLLLRQAGGSRWLAAGPFPVECHLFWVSTAWQLTLSYTPPQPVSSWSVLACHRNVLTRLRKSRETHCLTLEFRFFGLSWRTHILEFRQFLIDRGLKAHSLWIPYLSLRNIAFEASCVGRVTLCLKTLALRSIFSSNFP